MDAVKAQVLKEHGLEQFEDPAAKIIKYAS